MEQLYDIVFIGSGLSCTYTLKHLLEKLDKQPPGEPLKLLILEKCNEFWTGIAYGFRSSCTSLIITPLEHFIPDGEREEFLTWLSNNRDWVFDNFKERQGTLSSNWLRDNIPAFSDLKIDDVFVPRYVFGLYLQEKITALLNRMRKNGRINYEQRCVNVNDITKNKTTYTITGVANGKQTVAFAAKKVLLGVGSPPGKMLQQEKMISGSNPEICTINDPYEPSLADTMDKISRLVLDAASPALKNILIIGSNASALEVLYNLVDRMGMHAVNKFYVLSSSGAFPGAIKLKSQGSAYQPARLLDLANAGQCTADSIFEAIKADIAQALRENINTDDTYYPISATMGNLLVKLPADEKMSFVKSYGYEIGKLQRRAGSEYLKIPAMLSAEERLEHIQGRFVRYVSSDTGIRFEYMDSITGELNTHHAPIDISINCSGFAGLSATSSPLIQNLVRQQICRINPSDRGLYVNEKFEANDNFYVMGPLLAGNMIGEQMIWHAESCSRIFLLSQHLAAQLL